MDTTTDARRPADLFLGACCLVLFVPVLLGWACWRGVRHLWAAWRLNRH